METDENGNDVIKTVTLYAADCAELKLYTAVYNADGTLAGLKINDIEKDGESTVTIGAALPEDGYARLYLWRGMEPETAPADPEKLQEEQ